MFFGAQIFFLKNGSEEKLDYVLLKHDCSICGMKFSKIFFFENSFGILTPSMFLEGAAHKEGIRRMYYQKG